MRIGIVTKLNKKSQTVDIIDFFGNEFERVILPGFYASKNKDYVGRINGIRKNQLVLFDDMPVSDERIVIQFFPVDLNTDEPNFENFIKTIPSSINNEEDYVDYQKKYAVVYKKDSVKMIELNSESTYVDIKAHSNYKFSISSSGLEVYKYEGMVSKKVFFFEPETSKLTLEKSGKTITLDPESAKVSLENMGKKIVLNPSDTSTLATIGDGSMNVVNTKELKTWMEDTQKAIKGIIDAIKGGSVTPMDGGATLKSSIMAKLTKEPPEVPKDIDNTNTKIGKKGS